MRFILRTCIVACALILVTRIVPGIEVHSFYTAVLAAIFLGLLNAVVRPALILLTLPITILTLGIFIFIINASILLFVASYLDGFSVTGFFPALIGSVLLSVVSGVVNKIT